MRALITGINGQDGSYLAEYLLSLGYEVYGTVKRNSVAENQTYRLDPIYDQISNNLRYCDVTDLASIYNVLNELKPDEVYNLAAQSHVRISFDQPIYTAQSTGIGVLNMLEGIKNVDTSIKFYQASSSEMFGNNIDSDGYQRESTPKDPVSPYGCSKVFGYNVVRNYRKSYNLFACNGILFNHESPRRGTNFVTNKVVKGAVMIMLGKADKLSLGNLDATRDWGHAKDYVKAMHLILQQDKPDDYVCATGQSRSVRDLVEYTFGMLGLDWNKHITIDEKYFRPEELQDLKGDSSKLRSIGWEPEITFEEMIGEMIDWWTEELNG